MSINGRGKKGSEEGVFQKSKETFVVGAGKEGRSW